MMSESMQNGYSPVSMEEILAWFDGVECRGRVKWKDWVDETGDKRVRRKLCGTVKSYERLIFLSEPLYFLYCKNNTKKDCIILYYVI